jgi:hypothetical protein
LFFFIKRFLDLSNLNLNLFSSMGFPHMNFDTFFRDLLFYYINEEVRELFFFILIKSINTVFNMIGMRPHNAEKFTLELSQLFLTRVVELLNFIFL